MSAVHLNTPSPGGDHGNLFGLADDDHSQYALLAGRAGGQSLFGGTLASQNLTLRGTPNANLGLVSLGSPISFQDVTAAVALSPYTLQQNTNETIPGAFVGGFLGCLGEVNFSNAFYIWEGLAVKKKFISGVAPSFAAFTLFQALPTIQGGAVTSHSPLSYLVLNAGVMSRNESAAVAHSFNNAIGISFSPQLQSKAAFASLNCGTVEAVRCAPTWSTDSTTFINFGDIYGTRCLAPAQALFQTSAGAEYMDSYIGLQYDNQTLAPVGGGSAIRAAVRSSQVAGTNAYFLLQTGNALSEFKGSIYIRNDLTSVVWGAGDDFQTGWAAAGFQYFQFNASSDQLRWSNPSSDRFLFDSITGASEYNFNCDKFSLGAQTGSVGNQVGVFVAPTRAVAVGGEWSDFLLTQAGNLTVNAAMSGVFGWTINAPSITLGTGTVANAAALRVGGNVNQGTNRYGLSVISNPSGGTLNYCARFEGAAGVRVDGPLYAPGVIAAEGYDEITSTVGTTSATLVDITGLTFDLTIPSDAPGNGTIVADMKVQTSTTGGAPSTGAWAISINAADGTEIARYLSGTNDTGSLSVQARTAGLAPGTYTVKGRFRRVSGTSTVNTDVAQLSAVAILE